MLAPILLVVNIAIGFGKTLIFLAESFLTGSFAKFDN